jgi:hypothetical protein
MPAGGPWAHGVDEALVRALEQESILWNSFCRNLREKFKGEVCITSMYVNIGFNRFLVLETSRILAIIV